MSTALQGIAGGINRNLDLLSVGCGILLRCVLIYFQGLNSLPLSARNQKVFPISGKLKIERQYIFVSCRYIR